MEGLSADPVERYMIVVGQAGRTTSRSGKETREDGGLRRQALRPEVRRRRYFV